MDADGRAKVMIADDDVLVLRSMTLILRDMLGYEVVTVAAAAEILEVARSARPDVLLQDISMPGLLIDRHIEELRADPALRRLRIILISGGIARDTQVPKGADALVSKPFDGRTLGDVIQGVLRQAA